MHQVNNMMTAAEKKLSFLQSLCAVVIVLYASCFTSAHAASPAQIQEWLQAHNSYRALHSTPGVIWSAEVAGSAQAYADTCPTSHSGSGYGENLAWATYDMGRTAVVKMWYDEETKYDYTDPGFSTETGHFTQVVWKGTTEIGCGFKTGCTNGWENVWVCQYNPPGNYIGRFAENVLPPVENNPPPGGSVSQVPIHSLLLLQE